MKIQSSEKYFRNELNRKIRSFQGYLELLTLADRELSAVDRSDGDWCDARDSFLFTLIVRDEVEETLTKVSASAAHEVASQIANLDRWFKRLIGVFLFCNEDRRRQNVWPMEGREHDARQPFGWWWTYRIQCDEENHTCQACEQDKVSLILFTALFFLLPYGLLCPTKEELNKLSLGEYGRQKGRYLSDHLDHCKPCREKILQMRDA